MGQDPHAGVPGGMRVDDDPPPARITPAACGSGDRFERDGVPERLGQRLQRPQQIGMRVACQRLTRCLERDWLDAGKRLSLGELEHERGLEKHAPLVGLLAR